MILKPDYVLITPTDRENKHLDRLDASYLEVSEMSVQDRQFLNALILRHKPTKLVELGVSAGSSSIIILNAMPAKAVLHSIDYADQYYMDDTKKTGYIVDNYPKLKANWSLQTGNLAYAFMPAIGDGIDFCFIDTAHWNPGEILDTLMVLPYLSENAVIAYHDVNLPTFKQKVFYNINDTLTNNLLMSTVYGQKLIQGDFDWQNDPRTRFPNIGAIQINNQTRSHIFELVNLLTLKWSYCPTEREEKDIIDFMAQHYDKYLVEYTSRAFEYHRSKPVSTKIKLKAATKQVLEKGIGRKGLTKVKTMFTKDSSV